MTAITTGLIHFLVEVHQDSDPSGGVTLSCSALPAAQRLFAALLGARLADGESCTAVGGWVNLIGVIDPHDESVPRVLLQQERWET